MYSGADTEHKLYKRVVKKSLGIGVIVLAVAAVTAIAFMPARQQSEAPKSSQQVEVSVIEIVPLPELIDNSDHPGIVEANRVVKVAAEVSGRIERMAGTKRPTVLYGKDVPSGTPLDEGVIIKAGDELMYLNTDLLQAEYNRAAAQLKFDRNELERTEKLYEKGVATEKEMDEYRTRAALREAAMKADAERLARATIKSPIDGVLNRLPAETGEYVQPGDCVAEIVDTAIVKVVVDVPERDLHFLKVGQPVRILNSEPEPIEGIITFISELADVATRTTRVEIQVDNSNGQYRAGQTVRVLLTRQIIKNAIMIPYAAVIPLEEGKAVYVVENGIARQQKVKLGIMRGRQVQVVEGLNTGDKVIEVYQFVGPGQPVKIVPQTERES